LLDLLLLGNGAMLPLPNRWLSSLVVRYGSDLILIDCGEGSQIAQRKFGWGFKRISTICLSHWHADHVAGLPGILFSIANAERTDPVHVYGPDQTIRIVRGLCEIVPHLPFELIVHELADGDRFDLLPGMQASVIAGDHRNTPQLAWRFDVSRQRRFDPVVAEQLAIPRRFWGPLQRGETIALDDRAIEPDTVLGPERRGLALGFITDSRPLPAHVPFLHDVDLLVSEATYLESSDHEKAIAFGHMTMDEAVGLAQSASARRLLLTHFSATIIEPLDYADAAKALMPTAEIGVSGWTTTLSFADD
jgi:ribonuclease Z